MRRAIVYWSLGLGVLASGAWVVRGGGVPPWDGLGLAQAAAWRVAAMDPWVEAVTWLGSLFVLVPLTALAAWRLHRTGRRREAGFVLAALLGAAAVSHLVKHWVARPRPDLFPAWVGMPADWSYPSAHAMQATAVALALFLVYGARRRWRIPLVMLLGGVVALVGASRIYLQVHFPTDVLAGVLAAILWVAGLHALIVPRPIEWGER